MSEQKQTAWQRFREWLFPTQKGLLDLHPELRDRQPLMYARGDMWITADYPYQQAVNDHAGNVWMNKAVKVVSDAVAVVPLQVTQGGKPVAANIPLFIKPNETQSMADIWRAWAVTIMLGGECGLEVVKSKSNAPLEWWIRTPDVFAPVPVPQKKRYGAVAGYILDDGNGDPYTLMPDEFIHFKLINPRNTWRGVSPFIASRLSMKIDRHAREWARDFFESSARPDFAVMTPQGTTKTERNEILADVLAMYQGSQNNAIVLEQGVMDIKPLSFSPKDVNFVEQREMSRDEVAAAAGIPDILMGFGNDSYDTPDKRTNAEATMWSLTIKPLLDYRDQVLTAYFQRAGVIRDGQEIKSDLSEVMALQQRVDLFQYHIDGGIVTRDEVRQTLGFGDNKSPEDERMYDLRRRLAAMQAATGAGYDAITASELVGLPAPKNPPADAPLLFSYGAQDEGQIKIITPPRKQAKGLTIPKGMAVEFGSELHRELWQLSIDRTDPLEKRFQAGVEQLFKEQSEAVVAAVQREAKSIAELGDDPFDMEEWDAIFAKRMLPEFRRVMRVAGENAVNDVNTGLAFDMLNERTVGALRKLSQRFAKRVNDTTWRALKAALEEGLRAGEGADKLAARVTETMTLRTNQSAGAISRTEVQAANSTGTIEGWTQAGVTQKMWVSTFDDRVRDTHAEAHGQTVALDEDFEVGTATGQGPGLMDEAGEAINCRCTVLAVEE